jgi:hypothetical protein
LPAQPYCALFSMPNNPKADPDFTQIMQGLQVQDRE